MFGAYGQAVARLVFWLLLVALGHGTVVGGSEPPPRLVVVVIVDGLMPGQLARVEDVFVGGFDRMAAEGAVLTNCHHDHAITRTAPGYLVLLSGRHPGPVGILENTWFDPVRRRRTYCVEDSVCSIAGQDRRAGSYRNVFASALGDWLKQELPTAKVFSVAGKDRAAILMAGRAADGAYWYDPKTGAFVTSTYYRSDPHEWVERYNARGRPFDFQNVVWERVIADTALYDHCARVDDFPGVLSADHTFHPDLTLGAIGLDFCQSGYIRTPVIGTSYTVTTAAGCFRKRSVEFFRCRF